MSAIEEVLVVKRSLYEELGAFQGIQFNVKEYLDRLLGGNELQFIPRSQAETDPSYKQLIPYVIMVYEDTYLCYSRGKRAGEQRLTEKVSIGIGGHINPVDDAMALFTTDFREVYENAVEREVNEEVILETEYQDKIVGLLNDDSNEVGQVHLGIVHLWQLSEPKVQKREQMIRQLQFLKLNDLINIRDKMETWSQLCLDNLGEFTRTASIF